MGVFWAYLETEGPSKAFICLWLVANVIVFVVNWHKYAGDEFAFLRGIVGVSARHLAQPPRSGSVAVGRRMLHPSFRHP